MAEPNIWQAVSCCESNRRGKPWRQEREAVRRAYCLTQPYHHRLLPNDVIIQAISVSVARRSTGTAHRLVLFTGCQADSVSHTDSASGSSGFGYYVRQKPEAATTPEQSEGKPSLDSRVVASLWNICLQTMTVAASRLTL